MTRAIGSLRLLLLFIATFHLVAGCGFMFSARFQQFAVVLYGAHFDWNARDTYFIRIIGSFAFVLGSLAAVAARDPLKHRIVVIAFIEFFLLRNINRHLYSNELYDGFAVSLLVNDLTSLFFGTQAALLAALLWWARRQPKGSSPA